jgi:hypothetical protein
MTFRCWPEFGAAVQCRLREWRANSSRVTRAPIRDADTGSSRPRRRSRGAILVPPGDLSVSVCDDVILLAQVRADGEPLYLTPIDRETVAVLGMRLLELAGNDAGDGDGKMDRKTAG